MLKFGPHLQVHVPACAKAPSKDSAMATNAASKNLGMF
jgi:hypothetical protein